MQIIFVYLQYTFAIRHKVTTKKEKMQKRTQLLNLTTTRLTEAERTRLNELFKDWLMNHTATGELGKQADFIRFKLLQPNPVPAPQEGI